MNDFYILRYNRPLFGNVTGKLHLCYKCRPPLDPEGGMLYDTDEGKRLFCFPLRDERNGKEKRQVQAK